MTIPFIKLGWRNIFRNKRRSLLTGTVIGITLASLILQNSIMLGMMENIFNQATRTFLGQAQIHNKHFLDTLDIHKTIHNEADLLSFLNAQKNITFSRRAVGPALLSSPKNSISISLYGIDSLEEKRVSRIPKAIQKGSFSLNDHSILIGSKLADLLEIQLHDHIVLTVAQAKTDDLEQALLRIDGIFEMGEPIFDRSLAFIPLTLAQKLWNINGIHEIALQFTHGSLNFSIPQEFKQEIEKTQNQLLSWKQLIPSMEALLEMTSYATFLVMILVFILVIFIIINTFFMALFERMKEFGVLRAIGTKPHQLFILILIEAASLALISIIIGLLISYCIIAILSVHGLSFMGIDVGGVTIREPIYPIWNLSHITLYPLSVFAFTLISAIYPAFYAAKIVPIKALQKEG
ncbi:MAG: ABC transporter permease [Parachlamydiales bacterium]|nr:ABC transporter permease [Parachlamydiales bacterium]